MVTSIVGSGESVGSGARRTPSRKWKGRSESGPRPNNSPADIDSADIEAADIDAADIVASCVFKDGSGNAGNTARISVLNAAGSGATNKDWAAPLAPFSVG
jgi:hypothetical protein